MTELAGKTRLLVTHAIDFVHHADTLIIMDKGKVVVSGSFNEVKNHQSYKSLMDINKLGDNKKETSNSLEVPEETIKKSPSPT